MPENDRQNSADQKKLLQIAALVLCFGALKVIYWTLALEGTLFTWQLVVNTTWLLFVIAAVAMVWWLLAYHQRK